MLWKHEWVEKEGCGGETTAGREGSLCRGRPESLFQGTERKPVTEVREKRGKWKEMGGGD